MNRNEQAVEFVKSANILASITSAPKWGDMDIAEAKPIGLQQWRAAMTVAGIIAKECPWVLWPTPGADPEGFTWLSWASPKRECVVALEIHSRLAAAPYKWSQELDGNRTFHSSTSLRDVVESLRATFPKPQ